MLLTISSSPDPYWAVPTLIYAPGHLIVLNDMAHAQNVFDDTNPVKVLVLWWDTHSDTIFASPKQDSTMFSMLATIVEIKKKLT